MRCQVIAKQNEHSTTHYFVLGQRLETGKVFEMDLTEAQIAECEAFCGGKYLTVNRLDVKPEAPAPAPEPAPVHSKKR